MKSRSIWIDRRLAFAVRLLRSIGVFFATVIAMFLGLWAGHFLMDVSYSRFGYAPSYMADTAEGSALEALEAHISEQAIPFIGFVILMCGIALLWITRDSSDTPKRR